MFGQLARVSLGDALTLKFIRLWGGKTSGKVIRQHRLIAVGIIFPRTVRCGLLPGPKPGHVGPMLHNVIVASVNLKSGVELDAVVVMSKMNSKSRSRTRNSRHTS